MVVFWRSGFVLVKVVLLGLKSLYSGKGGGILANWLYLDKSGCIRAKVLEFGQGVCFL